MLHEAVAALNLKADGVYVDGTFGRGGHSRLILSQLGPTGRLIVFDRDLRAIEAATALAAEDSRVTVVHSAFSQMQPELAKLGINQVDGILLDLGMSSPQLDDASRGFSFMKAGPLDMRMDQSSGQTAREYLYSVDEATLAHVLWTYGEEKNSRAIARAIKQLAETVSFSEFLPDTLSLVELIKKASKKVDKNKNPATRSFQAIRIAVNGELEQVEQVLDASLDLLKPTGRLSVITFHSLEDRIVKQFLSANFKGKPIPKDMPIFDHQWDNQAYLSAISKALKPSPAEIDVNTRSRSAVLRWGERNSRAR